MIISAIISVFYCFCDFIHNLFFDLYTNFLFLFIRNMAVTRNFAQVEEEPIIADPPQGMPNTRGKRIKTVA